MKCKVSRVTTKVALAIVFLVVFLFTFSCATLNFGSPGFLNTARYGIVLINHITVKIPSSVTVSIVFTADDKNGISKSLDISLTGLSGLYVTDIVPGRYNWSVRFNFGDEGGTTSRKINIAAGMLNIDSLALMLTAEDQGNQGISIGMKLPYVNREIMLGVIGFSKYVEMYGRTGLCFIGIKANEIFKQDKEIKLGLIYDRTLGDLTFRDLTGTADYSLLGLYGDETDYPTQYDGEFVLSDSFCKKHGLSKGKTIPVVLNLFGSNIEMYRRSLGLKKAELTLNLKKLTDEFLTGFFKTETVGVGGATITVGDVVGGEYLPLAILRFCE